MKRPVIDSACRLGWRDLANLRSVGEGEFPAGGGRENGAIIGDERWPRSPTESHVGVLTLLSVPRVTRECTIVRN